MDSGGSRSRHIQDFDGMGVELESARKTCRRMYYAGFFLLPWVWATCVWNFWPEFKSGNDAIISRYTRRSALCFVIVSAIFLSWMLTYSIGREKVLGSKVFNALNIQQINLYDWGLLV